MSVTVGVRGVEMGRDNKGGTRKNLSLNFPDVAIGSEKQFSCQVNKTRNLISISHRYLKILFIIVSTFPLPQPVGSNRDCHQDENLSSTNKPLIFTVDCGVH